MRRVYCEWNEISSYNIARHGLVMSSVEISIVLLLPAVRRTDEHGEADGRLSQFDDCDRNITSPLVCKRHIF